MPILFHETYSFVSTSSFWNEGGIDALNLFPCMFLNHYQKQCISHLNNLKYYLKNKKHVIADSCSQVVEIPARANVLWYGPFNVIVCNISKTAGRKALHLPCQVNYKSYELNSEEREPTDHINQLASLALVEDVQ